MAAYEITSTTRKGDVEREVIRANSAIEAAFLMGVDFAIKGVQVRPELLLLDALGIDFTDTVRENLASMIVAEI